jgi:hypothetical protein
MIIIITDCTKSIRMPSVQFVTVRNEISLHKTLISLLDSR